VGPTCGGWDGGEKIKEDGCGRSEYEGVDVDDWNEIFRFEGGNGGRPVWMVLPHHPAIRVVFSFKLKLTTWVLGLLRDS
jgi:hypothetical protein